MDDLFAFVRIIFPPDRLIRPPANLVTPLRIPDRSKQFLLTVGLPRSVEFASGTLLFNRLDTLPTLRQLLPQHAARIDPGWDECLYLSADEDASGYVLNQADNGSIWSVESDSTNSDFVNSSVELFAWFLAAYTQIGTTPHPGTSEECLNSIRDLAKRMESMDPKAMSEDALFWPAIIEDAELYAG